MKVKSESEVVQSCPTPSDPMDCSLPGPSVHGIFQGKVGDSKAEGSLATGDGKQAAISLMSETDGTDCVSLLNSILFFFPLFMYFYFQMFFFSFFTEY